MKKADNNIINSNTIEREVQKDRVTELALEIIAINSALQVLNISMKEEEKELECTIMQQQSFKEKEQTVFECKSILRQSK